MHYQSCYFICFMFFSKIHSVCLIGSDPVKLVYFKKKNLSTYAIFLSREKVVLFSVNRTLLIEELLDLYYNPVQRAGLQHRPQSGPCMFSTDYGSRLGRQSQNHSVGTDAVGDRETYNSEVDQYI